MRIPQGALLRSRVVDDAADVLRSVLEEGLTGYVVFEPQDALLLGETTRGVVTFEDGIPVLAYDTENERGGRDGLEGFAVTGPNRVAIHAVDLDDLADAHDVDEFRVPPGAPARILAGDERLAERTTEAAPASRREEGRDQSSVEAFLSDADAIEAIRSEAREEARARASEWGLDDVLVDDDTDST
ncbi:hypothetical protein E6P09_05955 [Haloferax mediterranei ATCC 33500]|uniref:DUF8054 domain-containing protein n=1 Tax=Haloferax mediterranei (strain ATCC 33500 / DSM 1411 / JCM 8866 / NBRC 14739 / NCIMB 2177 / R-4) TaxID=523841 RepID=I3R247_HALMT|nr:hypothetical protein [Haloferax mediterranei]AFK18307.1 hypothetical protein HFX_0582 [Haloferax mediterranei ATCC 33500]AHZ22294.1 hypothetical protein BM92_06345 [Haloferax mediterranei ATCC 33500]EMA02421.1 hypothetical protein C439_07560 [Haloferax mediterranei ATCC 33500]MDX5988396.1 hypothetical protein [Haloferax mediterranei ATCC 33500]QCQ74824.1 hypothetical protein E6P09_05955 [Haloferax mediterranei ATCC 33500]